MTILTHPKSFQELLTYEDGTDYAYELIEGELKIVAPESEINAYIAECFKERLIPFFSRRLVKVQSLYIEVAPLKGMPLNREPDLVVLHPDHPRLMAESKSGKMAISNEMPPPLFIAEVVSPYPNGMHKNFARDYCDKPQQYAIRGIPEYWIIDPQRGHIEVNWDPDQSKRCYLMQATFQGVNQMRSQLPELKELRITADEILNPQ